MTTPAAPPQQQQQKPPPRQPPPPPVPPAIPPQALAAMALPLAVLLLTAASAAVVVAALKLRFILPALFWLALFLVLSRIVMAHPPQATGVTGHASGQVSRLNAARRAQFAIAAAVRVMRAMTEARSRGESMTRAGQEAVERERRYFQQHLDAMRQRAIAAARVDMAALEHGDFLGWSTTLDRHTSPECRAANGRNFYADRPPDIGYPGAVHPACRCKPVAPWPGGRLLPGSGPGYARAA